MGLDRVLSSIAAKKRFGSLLQDEIPLRVRAWGSIEEEKMSRSRIYFPFQVVSVEVRTPASQAAAHDSRRLLKPLFASIEHESNHFKQLS
jgi:hypothetical protein